MNIFTPNGTSISTYILDQPAAAHVGHRRSGYFPAPHRRRVGAAERIQEADARVGMALEGPWPRGRALKRQGDGVRAPGREERV